MKQNKINQIKGNQLKENRTINKKIIEQAGAELCQAQIQLKLELGFARAW